MQHYKESRCRMPLGERTNDSLAYIPLWRKDENYALVIVMIIIIIIKNSFLLRQLHQNMIDGVLQSITNNCYTIHNYKY